MLWYMHTFQSVWEPTITSTHELGEGGNKTNKALYIDTCLSFSRVKASLNSPATLAMEKHIKTYAFIRVLFHLEDKRSQNLYPNGLLNSIRACDGSENDTCVRITYWTEIDSQSNRLNGIRSFIVKFWPGPEIIKKKPVLISLSWVNFQSRCSCM